jgi:hypothetical protein
MRGTSSSSNGTTVLLTCLRNFGRPSRRRNGGRVGNRRRRSSARVSARGGGAGGLRASVLVEKPLVEVAAPYKGRGLLLGVQDKPGMRRGTACGAARLGHGPESGRVRGGGRQGVPTLRRLWKRGRRSGLLGRRLGRKLKPG